MVVSEVMLLSSDKPIGIGEFLRTTRLSVPVNQRAYAWRPAQVDDLFDDLGGYLEEGDYFLGWIVLSTETNENRPTIVDGQQRLATVCMFYAAIRDFLARTGRADVGLKLANAVFIYRRRVDSAA
jgi:uncharacterized protein with ParB-like and HNH nuclease domain